MPRGWRYFATQFDGAGSETVIDWELPLSTSPTLTRAVSAPRRMTAAVPFDIPRLTRPDGSPLFERWGTGIYAEDPNGEIRGGGILTDYNISGDGELALDIYGFTAYLNDLPFTEAKYWVDADPLNIYRETWQHVQAQPGGNLGVIVDSTTTPVRVGKEKEDVAFETNAGEQVAFEAGPYKMAPWVTDDIGSKMNDLAKATPFDYVEEDSWDGDGLRHFIRIGYPTLGTRRETGVRMVLGENVFRIPSRQFGGADVASEVLVLGSGEGRDKKRGYAVGNRGNHLRRVRQIDDPDLTTDAAVYAEAQRQAASLLSRGKLTELVVQEHRNAVPGSYDVGDWVPYAGRQPWGFVEEWVRVVRIAETPEGSNEVTLTVLHTGEPT